jgi:hypothetical protein
MVAVVAAANYVVRATHRHVIRILWRQTSHVRVQDVEKCPSSGTVKSDCRTTRPLPVTNNSVMLREGGVASFAAADLAFEKFLKRM